MSSISDFKELLCCLGALFVLLKVIALSEVGIVITISKRKDLETNISLFIEIYSVSANTLCMCNNLSE